MHHDQRVVLVLVQDNKTYHSNRYYTVCDRFLSPVSQSRSQRGQYNYWDKNPEHFNHVPVEQQVEGSTARYWHPQYRAIHSGVRMKLEKEIGRKLYNTYYYDRFYYPGQELTQPTDRDWETGT